MIDFPELRTVFPLSDHMNSLNTFLILYSTEDGDHEPREWSPKPNTSLRVARPAPSTNSQQSSESEPQTVIGSVCDPRQVLATKTPAPSCTPRALDKMAAQDMLASNVPGMPGCRGHSTPGGLGT